MQVTETVSEGLKRQFKVAISQADVETKIDARLADLAKTVQLPGFRKGKAPKALLKQRYLGSVMGEVLEAAVQDSSEQLLTERGLKPALQPKIEVTAFAEDKGLEYTMDLEILPEITPVDFATLSLERPKADVTDADVEKGLKKLAEQNPDFKAITGKRGAKAGDVTVIDFVGKLDGVEFPGGKGEDFNLELGSGMFIPGFEDQVIGAKTGEKREIKVTFPENYGAANLAGKEATFDVTVKEIREKAEPELNDEFAKKFGFDALDKLKDAVRQQVEREFAQASRMKVKRSLLDVLDEKHGFDVPPSLVDAEFNAIWSQYEQAKKAGESDPLLEGKSEDEVKAEYQRIANRRVRLGLLLSEVGRVNNIEVQEQELRAAVFDVARRYPGQERQVLEFYMKNQNALASLRAPIFEDKVVDYILEVAKVADKAVTPDELFADMAA